MHGTDENLKARRKIIEGLFSLLRTKRLSDISVSDIVEASSVARSTYYRNYENKEEVIEDFLDSLHREVGGEAPSTEAVDEVLSSEDAMLDQMERAFGELLKYKAYLVILQEQGLGMLVQQIIDRYLENALGTMPADSPSRYRLYFISGAATNVLMKWLADGAVETPREMARICLKMLKGNVLTTEDQPTV